MKMYKPTIKEKRKSSLIGWVKTGPKTFAFGYDQQGAINDPAIKPIGKQNARRGTTWKKRHKAAKLARRRNR